MKRLFVLVLCSLLVLSCASEIGQRAQSAAASSQIQQRAQPLATSAGCSPQVKYSFSFGSSGQMPGQFRSPSSISIDSFGNLLIADTGNNRVQKLDPSGNFLMEFGGLGAGGAELDRPTDAVENSLSIYVVDSMNERVLEYSTEGRFISVSLSKERMSGSDRGFGPRRLAFSSSGYVFLTDVEADAVIVLSRFWEPISVIGGFGSSEGRFSDPGGLVCTRSGEVLVCDSGNGRIQILDSLGNFVTSIPVCAGRVLCEPVDTDVGPDGSTYVVDQTGRRVLIFDSNKTFRCEISDAGGRPFVAPCAIAVSSRGLVYVLDGGSDVVQVFETGK